MKKLLFLFATIMALVAVACGGDDVDSTTPTPTPKPEPEEPVDPTAAFVVDITNVTRGSVTFNVTPKNPVEDYIYLVYEQSVVDAYKKEEYFVRDAFDALTEEANKKGMQLGEYIPQISKYGYVEDIKYTGLSMATDYYVIVFGVKFTLEGYVATTELVKAPFTTEDVEMSNATFDVKAKVLYNTVTLDVKPDDKELLWYICTMPKEQHDTYVGEGDGKMSQGAYFKRYFQDDINAWLMEYPNNPDAVIMALIHNGDESVGATGLHANTDYIYMVAGLIMDKDGIVIVTDITSGVYTTGDPAPSDMQFTIEVLGVQQMAVAYRITPTKLNEPYCALVQPYDGVSTKEEILEQLLNQWGPGWMSIMSNNRGVIDTSSKPKSLPAAGMEYYIIAFGYSGGVTTGVWMETFRTPDGGSVEDVEFSVAATSVTPYGFTMTVASNDPTIYYMAGACEKGEYNEELFIEDVNYGFDYFYTESLNFNSLYTVAETLDQYYYNGTAVLNVSGLKPNTEYMAYVYALDIKTGHVVKTFTYDAVARTTTVGAVNPTIKVVGYYSGDDEAGSVFGVPEVTAGKAIAVVTYDNFENAAELYSFVINGDGNDFSDLNEFPDATMWQLTSGFKWGLCPLDAPYSFYVIDWANECFALAYAVDKDGMTGRMARLSIMATGENKGDIDELAALYNELYSAEQTRFALPASLVVPESVK